MKSILKGFLVALLGTLAVIAVSSIAALMLANFIASMYNLEGLHVIQASFVSFGLSVGLFFLVLFSFGDAL